MLHIIMAALRSRCGHYIFALWFLLLLLFFLALSQRPQIGCLPYFHTWFGLYSANLEYRSEMCCTRLAANTGRKNDAKNRHLRTITQFCRTVFSQVRHVSTIGKKLVKQQYLSNMFSQCGKLRLTKNTGHKNLPKIAICWSLHNSVGLYLRN